MWAVGLIFVLGVVTSVAVGLVGVVGARHRAESAADLAALAGAVSARDGGDACAAAAALAAANDAELISCTADGDVVEVSVGVRSAVPWAGSRQQLGRARAGPADAAGL